MKKNTKGLNNPQGSEQKERRYISALKCDIVDSTQLSCALDQEAYWELINTFRSNCEEIISKYGGVIQQMAGDDVLAYFGYPYAHEDDPDRAVLCAQILKNRLREIEPIEDNPISCRYGVASGLVVSQPQTGVSATEYGGGFGPVPSLAARLQSFTEKNTILICDETRKRLTVPQGLTRLGPLKIKGFSEPITAWRVDEREEDASLQMFKPQDLAGREEEIVCLNSQWEKAQGEQGSITFVRGEAGIGKTGLIEHFIYNAKIDRESILFLNCSSYYESSPYRPITEIIKQAIRLKLISKNEKIGFEHIENFLYSINRTLSELTSTLCLLPNLDQKSSRGATKLNDNQKEKLQSCLVQIVASIASKKPTLVIVEDAHWLDPSSYQVLSCLRPLLKNLNLMIILTTRELDQEKEDHYISKEIHLKPLNKTDSKNLLLKLLPNRSGIDQIVCDIANKSAGIPLYLVELAQIVSKKVSQEGLEGREIKLPPFMQNALLARLDSAAIAIPETKPIAQFCAVYLEPISADTLNDIYSTDTNLLIRSFKSLTDEGVMVVNTQRRYSFRHDLLRQAVYESILFSERKRLHLLIGLHTVNSGMIITETNYEVVAKHFTLSESYENAIEWWTKAAKYSVSVAALIEAIRHYENALDMISQLSPTKDIISAEVQTLLELGDVYRSAYGTSSLRAVEYFELAQELARENNLNEVLCHALYGLFAASFSQSNYKNARKLSEQLLEIETIDDFPDSKLVGYQALGITDFVRGKFELAANNLETSLLNNEFVNKITKLKFSQYPFTANAYLAWTYFIQGNYKKAIQRLDEAANYLELADPFQKAIYMGNACYMFQWVEDIARVKHFATKLKTEAQTHGLAIWMEVADFFLAWCYATKGNIRQSRQFFQDFLDNTEPHEKQYFLTLVAELYSRNGDYQIAIELLKQAIDLANSSGEKWFIAESHRVLSIATIGHYGSTKKGLLNLDTSLDEAKRQGATLWEYKSLQTKKILALPNNMRSSKPNILSLNSVKVDPYLKLERPNSGSYIDS